MSDFQWKEADHLKLRPFKPIYHLTMGSISRMHAIMYMKTNIAAGIQSTTMSELVLMDRTYEDKIQ
jgi:hypothetical protein